MDRGRSGAEPETADGGGDRTVDEWRVGQRRVRRGRILRAGLATFAGVAFALGLGLSGRPAAGVDAAAILPASSDARLVWHPSYGMPWFHRGYRTLLRLVVGNHAVPIDRFPSLTRQLMDSGHVTEADLVVPVPADRDLLSRVHTDEYLDKLDRLTEGWILQEGLTRPGENRISSDLYAFLRASVGGTVEAGRLALDHGSAMNLSGGYHHAFPGHEEGFCFVNDVAIAIELLRDQGHIERAMIVDLDTHHGNGNASVFRHREHVAIFDMYEEDNYPATKASVEYPVALREGLGDEEYLKRLEELLPAVLETEPDLLFYVAGADPFENDVLGNQRLTLDGMRQRDEYVLEVCRALEVPCAVVLGGGYSTADEVGRINATTALTVLNRGGSPTRGALRRRVEAQLANLRAGTST